LIGGVVGGVVGGLALLTLLALALILWRRRKARTGHGWFLCFGRKPDRKDDWDVDWPTFDPTSGAAGVGGTMGEGNGAGSRRKSGAGFVGTLPDVDADEAGMGGVGAYGYYDHGNAQQEEMRDVGSYAGTAAPSYQSPTSDGHYRQNSQQWHMAPMASFSNAAHSAETPVSVPDYSHLDAPEVREARAREQAQAEAQAQALAAAAAAGGFNRGQSTSPPPAAAYSYGSASPPPQSSHSPRPLSSDHRLSQGTTQMLADNNFFDPQDESGTLNTAGQSNHHRLQLHNPDA
jgi:hypothetical protein